MIRRLRSLLSNKSSSESNVDWMNRRREELARLPDNELKAVSRDARDLLEIIASTAAVAARVLGLLMFDVQLQGALAANYRRIGVTLEFLTTAP